MYFATDETIIVDTPDNFIIVFDKFGFIHETNDFSSFEKEQNIVVESTKNS